MAPVTGADVERLRAALLAGGVALVPTDTVYGLAAALDVPAGVDALYALKGRPRSQPCQVLVYSADLVDEALAPVAPRVAAAARALLPGPATCIVPDPSGRYRAATGDAVGSVGLRAPDASGALAPLAELGIPLVATSANDPGGPDPRTVDDVPAPIRDAVAAVVDAGPLPGTASAVVDLTAADRGEARLLRPGPDPAAVAAALLRRGVVVVHPSG
jgi:L-threonylcarbamoyladenylate synthase